MLFKDSQMINIELLIHEINLQAKMHEEILGEIKFQLVGPSLTKSTGSDPQERTKNVGLRINGPPIIEQAHQLPY